MEDWNISSENRDEIYETLHMIHPVSKKASQESLKGSFLSSLNGLESPTEKEQYIQDNFYQFPSEMIPELQDIFLGLRRKNAGKDFERARIAMSLEVGNLLQGIQWEGLDGSKSIESHLRSFLKAYDHSLMESVSVDDNGDISFASPEGRRPAYVLPETEDLTDRFIFWNDLAPIIRKSLKTPLEKSRMYARSQERESTEKLYNSLHKLPTDVVPSVVVDYALNQKDPSKAILKSLKQQVNTRVNNGEASSFKDIARIYVEEQGRVEHVLAERMRGYNARSK